MQSNFPIVEPLGHVTQNIECRFHHGLENYNEPELLKIVSVTRPDRKLAHVTARGFFFQSFSHAKALRRKAFGFFASLRLLCVLRDRSAPATHGEINRGILPYGLKSKSTTSYLLA